MQWTDAMTPLAMAPGHVSIVKLVVMFVLLLPFFAAAPWVQKDARRVRLKNDGLWAAIYLAIGAGGFLIWLLLPVFVVGLVVYVIAVLGALLIYAVIRDSKVEPEDKLLSAAGLKNAFGAREQKSRQVQVESKVKLYDAWAKVVLPPDPKQDSSEDVAAFNLVQDLMHNILWFRASEADLTPGGEQTRVRFVVDGVPQTREAIPVADSEAIIQYLKKIANMNAEERRRPQKGKMGVDLANAPVDVELVTKGTTSGQYVKIRVVQELVQTDIEKLGMPEDVLAKVRKANQSKSGMVLVAGRPGNGLTSTSYSLMRDHDAFVQHLMTVESDPAVDLENITQQAYGPTEKLPNALAQTLRRDPDVVYVDDCPDEQTAELVRNWAGDKNVILTLYARDTFSALAKWVKACGSSECVDVLNLVLCQVLLRKLCPTCKQPYKPDPQLLAKANLPADKIDKFYNPSGVTTDEKGNESPCPTCQGSGYFGRTAAFELLEVTDDLRKLVADGAQLPQIRSAARKNRMLYLQEQAMRKVMTGETSIKEVIRVTQQQAKS